MVGWVFEKNEWASADDYFRQMCTLSAEPFAIMQKVRDDSTTTPKLQDFKDLLEKRGIPGL